MTIVIRCKVKDSSGRHKRVTLILTLQIKVWWGKRTFPSSVVWRHGNKLPCPAPMEASFHCSRFFHCFAGMGTRVAMPKCNGSLLSFTGTVAWVAKPKNNRSLHLFEHMSNPSCQWKPSGLGLPHQKKLLKDLWMEDTVRNLQSVKHIGGYKEDYLVKEKIRLSDYSMIGNTHLIGTIRQLGSFHHSQQGSLSING